MSRPRIRLPRSASPGEVIEIRTLVDHPMVSGVATGASRDMLQRFEARMNGETIFETTFRNGTSANPYLVFFARLDATSDFEFVWTHESGKEIRADGRVEVS